MNLALCLLHRTSGQLVKGHRFIDVPTFTRSTQTFVDVNTGGCALCSQSILDTTWLVHLYKHMKRKRSSAYNLEKKF